MARMLETNLIRLQCYEGLDASAALYEWNYQKQLLHIKLRESAHRPAADREGARDLLGAVPAAAAAAAGDQPQERVAGAAGGRGRPRRRGVRGVHAGGVLGLAGDDPRDRHHQGHAPAARDPDLEPHPRAVATRSAAAASTSGSTTRRFDKEVRIVERKVPGINAPPGPRDRALHGVAAPGAAGQGAGRGRDARLGPGAGRRSTPTTSTRRS